MASQVVITFNIMPESPEVDLEDLAKKCSEILEKEGEIGNIEYKPIAFGLKSLEIMNIRDESKGSTEELEKEMSQLEGVNSVEVTDVRRTVDL